MRGNKKIVTVDIGGMTELYARSMRELCGIGHFSEEFMQQILKEGSPLTKGCLYITCMRTKYCIEDFEGAFRDVREGVFRVIKNTREMLRKSFCLIWLGLEIRMSIISIELWFCVKYTQDIKIKSYF